MSRDFARAEHRAHARRRRTSTGWPTKRQGISPSAEKRRWLRATPNARATVRRARCGRGVGALTPRALSYARTASPPQVTFWQVDRSAGDPDRLGTLGGRWRHFVSGSGCTGADSARPPQATHAATQVPVTGVTHTIKHALGRIEPTPLWELSRSRGACVGRPASAAFTFGAAFCCGLVVVRWESE